MKFNGGSQEVREVLRGELRSLWRMDERAILVFGFTCFVWWALCSELGDWVIEVDVVYIQSARWPQTSGCRSRSKVDKR